VRKDANKLLEKARQGENRIIGNSLDAKITLATEDPMLGKFLKDNMELVELVTIVSAVELGAKDDGFTAGEELPELMIKVEHAPGEKCERCWKYSEDLGTNPEHPTLCPRCSTVMAE
ncbi:MAG: zinc finger domain-containing protein, partial [Fusobacteriaceae bacterium]